MSNELVRTVAPDTIAASAELGTVADARAALDRVHDLTTARDFQNKAEAAAGYFHRAKETRHLASRATEVRIWAERRAGWLILDQHTEDDMTEIARYLSTSIPSLRRWVRLAKAPEGAVEKVIIEIRASDVDLTVSGVDRRLQTKGLERVERGIYRNYLGRYVIRWRVLGRTRQRLMGLDLPAARRELLIVTGAIKAPSKTAPAPHSPARVIADVYGDVRILLQHLEDVKGSFPPGARRSIESAQGALYKAEDALGRAMRNA